MKSSIQPENILRCLTAEVRKEIGQKTEAEALAVSEIKLERELHKLILNDLNRRRSEGEPIWWVHSRMDRKNTATIGTPDFIVCLAGRCYGMECKVGKNALTIEQGAEGARIMLAGGMFKVCRTFQEYRNFIA